MSESVSVTVNGLIYDLVGGTYTLYGGTPDTVNVTIASSIGGINVTVIGEHSLTGANIISVTIPSTITTIENGAFEGCISLATVVFDGISELITIGAAAFGHSNVTGIVLPPSVTSIGNNAFQDCGNNNDISNCTPTITSNSFINFQQITVFVNQTTYDTYGLSSGYTPNVTFRVPGAPNGSPVPIATICFVAGTLVDTDQGEFPIESLTRHTLRGQPIQVTQTVQLDPWIVKINARAFGTTPTRDTYVTKNHRIYQGSWVKAFDLVNGHTVTLVKHQGYLYNVLVDTHTSMNVHGMRVETLDPNEPTAKLYPRPKQPKKIKNRFMIMV